MQILQRKNYLAVEDRTIDAGQFVGVLAVLDDINFAVRYCDSLCLLSKGKLVWPARPVHQPGCSRDVVGAQAAALGGGGWCGGILLGRQLLWEIYYNHS